MFNRLISKPKTWIWLFVIITLAHLVIFIKYPFTDVYNAFTTWGEHMKSYVPYLLLLTLMTDFNKYTDKIVRTSVINIAGLAVIATSIICQVAGISGQAWSTVAFSGILILLLYNSLVRHYNISRTILFTFSFMIVWLGWVVFESVFQTGLWFNHPMAFGKNINNYGVAMFLMARWMIPSLVYIFCCCTDNKLIKPKIEFVNKKLFAIILGIFTIAVTIWCSTGMLIPIPVNEYGIPYQLHIDYWSIEHLQFSISRLSQISIMSAFVVLFLKRGVKS